MTDRPFLGILLMLGFCVLAPLGDAMAKLLGDDMSVGFLVFVRFAVQVALLLPLVWLLKYPMPKGAKPSCVIYWAILMRCAKAIVTKYWILQ